MPSQTRRSIARLPPADPPADDRLDGRRELVGVGALGGGDQPSCPTGRRRAPRRLRSAPRRSASRRSRAARGVDRGSSGTRRAAASPPPPRGGGIRPSWQVRSRASRARMSGYKPASASVTCRDPASRSAARTAGAASPRNTASSSATGTASARRRRWSATTRAPWTSWRRCVSASVAGRCVHSITRELGTRPLRRISAVKFVRLLAYRWAPWSATNVPRPGIL